MPSFSFLFLLQSCIHSHRYFYSELVIFTNDVWLFTFTSSHLPRPVNGPSTWCSISWDFYGLYKLIFLVARLTTFDQHSFVILPSHVLLFIIHSSFTSFFEHPNIFKSILNLKMSQINSEHLNISTILLNNIHINIYNYFSYIQTGWTWFILMYV